MQTTEDILRELAEASLTFKGGTVLIAENRDRLVEEMHTYMYLRTLARHSGASPYEIEQAAKGPLEVKQ